MAKTITSTEIIPRNGKMIAQAHWEDGEKTGVFKETFEDFDSAQVWLNDHQTKSPDGNIQAQTIRDAANHNLELVIDQLESTRHSKLSPAIDQLKSIHEDLSKIEL